MKATKEVLVKEDKSSDNKEKSPYINKSIYENYSKGMKAKNIKRLKQGLEAIKVRSFEEWSN